MVRVLPGTNFATGLSQRPAGSPQRVCLASLGPSSRHEGPDATRRPAGSRGDFNDRPVEGNLPGLYPEELAAGDVKILQKTFQANQTEIDTFLYPFRF